MYTRSTYSLLDYLRDIGGLFGAFNAIFGSIVFVLNLNGLYQLLTSTMFRVQTLTQASHLTRIELTRGRSQMEKDVAKKLASRVTGEVDS